MPGAAGALAGARADLPAIDPAVRKPSVVHEPARQKQNYINMRKVFARKDEDGDASSTNPFDEEDVGRRFQLLKEQMHVEENASTLEVKPSEPAGPISGSTKKKNDFADYRAVNGTHIPV